MTSETEDAQEKAEERIRTSARRARRKARSATAATKKELSMPGFSPAVVGFLRGLLHAAAIGILNYVIAQLGGVEGEGAGAVGIISTVLVGTLRSVEGLLDVKLGAPRQARRLGGKPVGR